MFSFLSLNFSSLAPFLHLFLQTFSNRYYHNLSHLKQILDVIYEMRSQAHNFLALQIAAWFHDAIYNPKATDNEEKSAFYARNALKTSNLSLKTTKKIEKLILITKNHTSDGDFDNQIFLDAALSILGTSLSKYQIYAKAIRQEYSWVPEQEYCLKRKRVLDNFLNRDRIYSTKNLFNKLEKQARKNIQVEILSLSYCLTST
jgi:predicted metal-dependent HD superfamily phosphohydrolase